MPEKPISQSALPAVADGDAVRAGETTYAKREDGSIDVRSVAVIDQNFTRDALVARRDEVTKFRDGYLAKVDDIVNRANAELEQIAKVLAELDK